MVVGLKYCGGCNPYYERTQLAARIRAELQDKVSFESVSPEKEYDAVIIISGCVRRCMPQDTVHSRYGVIYTTSEKDFDYAVNFITDVYERMEQEK